MSDTQPQKKRLLESVWDLFASIRLTVGVLLALAATAVIGTLIPQAQPAAFYAAKYGESWARLIDLLQVDDMYHSHWFQALILMLAANILVCTVARLKTVWKIVFSKAPAFSENAFTQPADEPFTVAATPESLKTAYQAFMEKRFSGVTSRPVNGGFMLFAEKGRATRLGVYGVHLSVLVLLLGALVGSFAGFDGYVQIPEGESVSSISLRDSDAVMPLGFEIRCDDFDASFYESGRPKEYRSTLSILENGKVMMTRDIVVNRPLGYRGVRIFQSSYGTASARKAVVVFTSKATGMAYRQTMDIGDRFTLPENLGTFTLARFANSFLYMGQHDVGPSFVGVMETAPEKTQTVVLPIRHPSFDRMRGGDVTVAVENFESIMYTGLQVAKDPGVHLVYAGFILMILGIYVTFFTAHQKFAVRVAQEKKTTTVTVFATANKNRYGAKRKAREIGQRLSRLNP
ncbi:MAG: cytochrome c biogenesis protein ResB [Thermodesulfobacteriota bacterium]